MPVPEGTPQVTRSTVPGEGQCSYKKGRQVATHEQPDKHPDGRPRFTSEQAREAGRKSGEARRQKKAQREASQALALAARLRAVDRRADGGGVLDATDGNRSQPYDLRTGAFEAANLLIDRVLSGQVEIRHGSDLAALIDKVHTVYRLETGQSTSNSATLSMSSEQAIQRLDEARGDLAIPTTGDEAT